ncbi:hypothetical protein FQZ97_913110 [compost metagenome]
MGWSLSWRGVEGRAIPGFRAVCAVDDRRLTRMPRILALLRVARLRSTGKSDLDCHEQGRRDDKQKCHGVECGVEGDHDRLTGNGAAEKCDRGSAGGNGIHPPRSEHGSGAGQAFNDGLTSGIDAGAEDRNIGGNVMVDKGLKPRDANKAPELAPGVEKPDPGREVSPTEIAKSDQRDRQKQEAKAKATQKDRGHHVVRTAFTGRPGQHPHCNHDQQDTEGHGCEWSNTTDLHEKCGKEQRPDKERAARQEK